MDNLQIISVRENPEYAHEAVKYFQSVWKSNSPEIYEDAITNSVGASRPLPQWYLLLKENEITGCAGLITNDFISRMDLYPWVCSIFVAEEHRGHNYGKLLLDKALTDAKTAGFDSIYLCTDHKGYYEKFGYKFIGFGYHPWHEISRIYELKIS
ncbi:MAG: N-acetyltransferase [Melioribacteraceae bacterium]|nr:MAG: N-acetyltransferase [Melioribacteraceae bacterium]